MRIALFVLTALLATAQAPTKEEKVIGLLKTMNMQPILENMVQQQMAAFKKMAPQVPEKLWDEIGKEMRVDELLEKSAAIYSTHFSEAEIDDMLRFYSTPTGKKMLAKMPVITTESMEMGRQWGTAVATKVAARLKAEGLIK